MESNIRYQAVPADEQNESDSTTEEVSRTDSLQEVNDQNNLSAEGAVGPPPAYEAQASATATNIPEEDKPDYTAPPSYDVATKLPTYDEVTQQKQAEAHGSSSQDPAARGRHFAMFQMDVEEGGNAREALLGTDFIFFISFCVAFLFNWLGFLLLLCFCHTVAGRYGAISGFGLSLAKWTLIVKHSAVLSPENGWLYWLIMGCGLLVCVRAIFAYLRIKQDWNALTRSAQERLLFFY